MPSNFTKQIQYTTANGKYLNTAGGDSQLGGTLTTVPAAVGASQGVQDIPGDRIVLGASDAYALSNTTVGTLYAGMYEYLHLLSTAPNSAIGKLALWDPSAFSIATTTTPLTKDGLYQITSAEPGSGAGPVGPMAGIFINVLTAGNYWWVQIAGKATASFGPATNSQYGGTSTYLLNGGVYAMGAGTTNGSGFVTQIQGTTFVTTNAGIDAAINQYIGVAEVLPAASTLSIVDIRIPFFQRF